MATLIGTVPFGSTFQDLVDVTTAGKMVGFPPLQEQRGAPMRIYLPEGVLRVMALTKHQTLQVYYSRQDNRPLIDDDDSEVCGAGIVSLRVHSAS